MSHIKSDYLETVEEGITKLHQSQFAEIWEGTFRDEEWGGRHKIVQDFAFIFSVLYKRTGNQQYRNTAIRYLLDFGNGYHAGAIFCGTAYHLLKEELTDAERTEFAKQWTADAAGALDRYVGTLGEVEKWDTVSNHAIAASFYADYARELFPEQASSYDYERHTDAVWDTWWKRREFHEQASHYEAYAEAHLSRWAELRDLEAEFYATPSVRNMLERNLKVVTPAGNVTPYGDSTFHRHLCRWIAFLEKVATDLQDGRFKRTARTVFSYFDEVVRDSLLNSDERITSEDDIYNRRLKYAGTLHRLAWLAMASLWTDHSLDLSERPERTGRIQRLPFGYTLDEHETEHLPTDRLVDSQIALAGGSRRAEDRTYLLLSVGSELVHDHADASAIQILTNGSSTLLGTNGYLQREPLYHNGFYVQPRDVEPYPIDEPGGVIDGDSDCRGTISSVRITDRTAHCRVHFEKFMGFPLRLIREVTIDEDGGVTLLDQVIADEPGYCGGPLFHGERINHSSGQTYELRIETLCSMDGLAVENPSGNLIISFDRPGKDVMVRELSLPAIYSEEYQEFPANRYKQVWQRSYSARHCLAAWQRFAPGEKTVFETHLQPTD